MKLCIPVEENKGLESKINAHFGSAPCFLIYNTDKDSLEIAKNNDEHHMHGMCDSLKVLANKHIDAVICIGMGARAVQKLNEGGIKAYRANAETVAEIIKKYQGQELEEITIQNACVDHNCT